MSEKYVAEYLRISDDDEDLDEGKKESNSIANQRRVLESYINSHEELSKYSVKEFVDDGVSGVSFNRPGIQNLLNEVKGNRIACIIVKDLSRFGRNYIAVGDYIEQIFPFLGVRFIAVSDNFDSAKTTAGLDIGFKNLIHDLYSRDLSKKVKSVKALRQKAGDYSGGDVPYGYRRNDGEGSPYVPDPEAAGAVRKIFLMAAEGNTMTQIATRLNQEKIPTPGAYKKRHTDNNYRLKNEKSNLWSSSQVGQIIRNEVYLGTFVGHKFSTVRPREERKNDKSEYIKIRNHHERLVDEALFRKAQNRIRPPRKMKNGPIKGNPSPLKGKVKCGCCGYGMSFKHTSRRDYYYCRMGDGCGSHTQIESETLEKVVWNILQKFVEAYREQETAHQSDAAQMLSAISNAKEEKRILETNAEHCKIKRIDLYHKWKEGCMEKDEYIAKKNELLRRETEYRDKLAVLNRKMEEMASIQEVSGQKIGLASFSYEKGLTKELVDEIIERIEVYSSDRVEIQWKFRMQQPGGDFEKN